MIALAKLDVHAQVLVLVGQLHARGIASEKAEDGTVLVAFGDFESAFALLIEADLVSASPWTGEACPRCGMHMVRDVGVNWKRASWGFLLLTAGLLGLPLLWRKRTHHCLGCGGHWDVPR